MSAAGVTLRTLAFSDLFVGSEPAACWLKETPDARHQGLIPAACAEELAALSRQLLSVGIIDSGKFEWAWDRAAAPLRLRVQRIDTIDGPVFVCARPRERIAKLAELGVPQAIANRLLGDDVRDGLILFMGETRAGKSTTAASFAVEHVSRHGGVCWSVESPIELPIHGHHGRGQVYQTEVQDEAEFGSTIREMLRAAPNLMFIGEVREEEAARQAVLAGLTGLVVTTVHAATVAGGLERFADMCGSAANLASALRAVVHVRLRIGADMQSVPTRSPVGAPGRMIPTPRVLSVTPLIALGEGADTIRSHVRGRQFHQLASEIDRQKRAYMQAGTD
jgi:twitching motility protein PilT